MMKSKITNEDQLCESNKILEMQLKSRLAILHMREEW